MAPLLQLEQITKTFGEKVANDAVDLKVERGKILALVGENGAGKTTLMTMCAGLAEPDSGRIIYDGREVRIDSPNEAHDLGIGMVHQHFKLVPSLTVADNVFLGREIIGGTRSLDRKAMERRVQELSEQFGLRIDPAATISKLSVGLRQRVEVLKALSHDTELLILDEPTAVLTPQESEELFEVMRGLANAGRAVVFITHKLGEVLAVADDIAVMRDGELVTERPAAGMTEADIASLMVGREVLLRVERPPANPTDPVLVLENLDVNDDRGHLAVNGIDLTVRAGEIVGIAGVEGNGQSEMAQAIAGMREVLDGTIELAGERISKASVAKRRNLGLATIPEDRNATGVAANMTIAENLSATHLDQGLTRGGWLRLGAIAHFARKLIRRYDVRGASPEIPVGSLSGGNVQKVIIAREFEAAPSLLLANQPTRGVDVGAMEFVHNAIVQQRDGGSGVLLISADLNEVMSLSDRLMVMYGGKIVAEFNRQTMDETRIGLAMAGVPDERDAVDAEALAREAQAPTVAAQAERVVVESPEKGAGEPTAAAASGTAEETPYDYESTLSQRILSKITTSGKGAIQPIVAVVLALIVGAVVIAITGGDPMAAYDSLLFGSFRSSVGISALVAQLTPLLIIAASVVICFRTGLFNIGAEGQMYVGAFFGAWAAFTFDLPALVLIPFALIVGAVAGAIWSFIPGFLLAVWKVDVIVTTLMLNYVAIRFTEFLVNGPFKDESAGAPMTERIHDQAELPRIPGWSSVNIGLIIAVVSIIVIALLLNRSVWGLKLRQVGDNPNFARFMGINVPGKLVQVMVVSGLFAGLAGAVEALGTTHRFFQGFSPGYGFLGLTVALLARLNPWAAIIAGLFYANMLAGANVMQLNNAVPFSLVSVLQGILIVFMTAEGLLAFRRRKRRLAENAGDAGAKPASESTPVESV